MKHFYQNTLVYGFLLIVCTLYVHAEKPDTCWSFNIDDIDLPWEGYYTPNISDIKTYKGGFLAAGFASNVLFPSENKKELPRNKWIGEYLCRYDKNGKFLWHLNSNMSDFNSHNERPSVVSVTCDKNDIIYIGGYTGKNAMLYTPDSLTCKVAYCPDDFNYNYNGYVAKIDSNGSVMWNGVFPGGKVKKVCTDAFGNIYVMGQTGGYLYYYDGKTTTTLHESIQEDSDFIVALDSAGKIRWHTYFTQWYTNVGGAKDFGVDGDGNLYVAGVYELEVRFYSSEDVFFDSIRTNAVYGGRLFLTKIDRSGRVQWVLACSDGNSSIEAMQVDIYGNCYLSGSVHPMSSNMVITNADKSRFQAQSVGYLVMKVSNDGIVQWESGNKGSHLGYAHDVTLREKQVSVIGFIQKSSTIGDDWKDKLFFNGGRDTTITLTTSEYFVANYDTSGNLRYIAKSGTQSGTLMKYEKASIDLNERGHFLSVNGGKFTTFKHVDFFGNRVLLTGIDGIIAHIGNAPCVYSNVTSAEDNETSTRVDRDESFFGLPIKTFANAEQIIVMTSLGEIIQQLSSNYTDRISTAFDSVCSGVYFVIIKYKNGSEVVKKIQIMR